MSGFCCIIKLISCFSFFKVKGRDEVKVKKLIKQGDFKKESQVLPKPSGKSSAKQADGAKVESEATSSKPDSSSLLFAAEEAKSEPEIVALEYEDNMVSQSIIPSLWGLTSFQVWPPFVVRTSN